MWTGHEFARKESFNIQVIVKNLNWTTSAKSCRLWWEHARLQVGFEWASIIQGRKVSSVLFTSVSRVENDLGGLPNGQMKTATSKKWRRWQQYVPGRSGSSTFGPRFQLRISNHRTVARTQACGYGNNKDSTLPSPKKRSVGAEF